MTVYFVLIYWLVSEGCAILNYRWVDDEGVGWKRTAVEGKRVQHNLFLRESSRGSGEME